MFSRLIPILLLLPSLAWGFTLINQGMKGWEKKEVRLYFNPADCSVDAAEIEAAIGSAVDVWNSVSSADVKLNYEGQSSQTGTQPDPLIQCATSGLDDSIGVTSVVTENGRIFTGYVALNSDPASEANIQYYRGAKLEVVIAHELGHVLGLGHAASESALMYYSIGSRTQPSLSQDDVDGVSFLYPRREPENGAFGCGTLGLPPGGGGGGGLLAVLALAGLVSFVVRTRRFAVIPARFA